MANYTKMIRQVSGKQKERKERIQKIANRMLEEINDLLGAEEITVDDIIDALEEANDSIHEAQTEMLRLSEVYEDAAEVISNTFPCDDWRDFTTKLDFISSIQKTLQECTGIIDLMIGKRDEIRKTKLKIIVEKGEE